MRDFLINRFILKTKKQYPFVGIFRVLSHNPQEIQMFLVVI
jgi:hypothetical protein